MKKIYILYLLYTLALLAFIQSCKHEFPVPNPPGTGGENPPVITTSCSSDTAYFQQQVLPLFVSNCSSAGCHDAGSHQSGIVLTTYNSIMTTGKIQPGQPNRSKAWEKIVENNYSDRMPPPPYNPLTQAQKDIIYTWIMQGAKNNSCQNLQCDTTQVTYSATIKPMLLNYCIGCHNSTNASGGYDLTQYNVVKARVDDGRLWGSVNFLPGYYSMPKNGQKLSDCELTQLNKWISNGAPNN
jgi:hypothetical protein